MVGQHGGGCQLARAEGSSDLPLYAGVQLDLVARGRITYYPRGEVPLDKSMDRGFVGHQVSEQQAAFDQMEARLNASITRQLTAQGTAHTEQLAAQSLAHTEQLAAQSLARTEQLAAQSRELQAEFRAEFAKLHRATTVPFVRNVAAQCLNKALGKTGQVQSKAFAAAMGRPDGSQQLKQLVTAVFGPAAHTDSGARLDTIITRRNIETHMDEPNLAAAVQQALVFINESSVVGSHCADEMLVLGVLPRLSKCVQRMMCYYATVLLCYSRTRSWNMYCMVVHTYQPMFGWTSEHPYTHSFPCAV